MGTRATLFLKKWRHILTLIGNSLHEDFPSEEKEHFADIIVLEGVIIPWMLPEVNDGSCYVFPLEIGRAVRVLSESSGITCKQGLGCCSNTDTHQ